jgi:hypothetical protein
MIGIMRNSWMRFSVLGLGLGLMASAPVSPREVVEDKVILVDLDVKQPNDAAKAYSSAFDRKKVEVPLTDEDPIFMLEDYTMAEDPLEGPDCFMPEMKFIFNRFTYVFSLYCTAVQKYSNSAPYTPSSKRVTSDIEVTESVLRYLQAARTKYFGVSTDPKVVQNFLKPTKFEEDKLDDNDVLKDDEEDDDDVTKDAVDKEGWFDDKKDPGLEEDETPEVPDDGGGH